MLQSAVCEPSTLVPALRQELHRLLAEADAHPVMSALMAGTATREQYVEFLAQTRHYVERTYPVLAAAGRRLHDLRVHRKLADLYMQKAEEEQDHDILIDHDLKALGLDPKATLAAGPGPSIRAYNARIEAVSRGDHPSGFLGSAYILEGLAVERARVIAKAMRETGRVADVAGALSFLDLLADADIGHVDDLERILARLDDDREQEAIALTATVTRELYIGMLGDVMAASVAPSALM